MIGVLLSERGQRIFDWIGCGMGLAILGGLGLLDYSVHKREGLARELRPYVEAADGKPGISRQDRIDFARRANLHEWMLKEIYKNVDLQLEFYLPSQALRSYEDEVK